MLVFSRETRQENGTESKNYLGEYMEKGPKPEFCKSGPPLEIPQKIDLANFGGWGWGVRNRWLFQKRKISPKRKFSAGRPCGPKPSVRPSKSWKRKQAFRHGYSARTSTKKLRSEKFRITLGN